MTPTRMICTTTTTKLLSSSTIESNRRWQNKRGHAPEAPRFFLFCNRSELLPLLLPDDFERTGESGVFDEDAERRIFAQTEECNFISEYFYVRPEFFRRQEA